MRKFLAIFFFWALCYFSWAQETPISVTGTLIDQTDGSAIIGATVLFVNVKDSSRSRYAISNGEGLFLINDLEQAFYRINIASLSYKPYTKIMRLTVSGDLGKISMEQDTRVLDNVEVKGEVVAMEQIGDTVQYNAQAFKTNPDASAKDLVSKMPGIVVGSDGVTANGESIQQVLVDGKRFFGQDPLLSLNTLPAEVVDKIQVYDEESEQSQLTGFSDGNTTKTMNVVTKKDKRNGEFGEFYAGYGQDEHYKLGTKLNSFKGDRRITLTGISNNINQQNFSSQDLAGVSNGRRGGFRNSGGNGMVGTQSGITKTNSIGLNFNNVWNDKLSLEGSYFFNKTQNTNNEESRRETFLEEGSQYYNAIQASSTDNWNHRLNMRIRYEMNENNTLTLSPRLSYQNNEGNNYTSGATQNEAGETINQTENTYLNATKAYSFSNNLIYQHKFEKIGRTMSVDANTSFQPVDRNNLYEDHQVDSLTEYTTNEGNYTLSSTVTYTEPVGAYSQLSAIYSINYNHRDSEKESYLIDGLTDSSTFSPELSNVFESKYITHSPSLAFATRKFGQFFNARLTYQRAVLDNEQTFPSASTTNKGFNSLLPTLMGRMEFGEHSDLFFRYTTSTDVPSVNQLQEVIDNSNPLFITVGNAGLKQSYSHRLMARVGTSNVDKNWSVRNFTNIQTTNNYIATSTGILQSDSLLAEGVYAQQGTQISRPTNISGYKYWSVQNSTTYSFLVSKLKTNVSTTLGLNYSRRPGLTNDFVNMANTYTGSLRVNFASNISEKVDFNVYYNASTNRVINSIQAASNSQYLTQTTSGKLNLMLGKHFVFRNEVTYQKYNGVSASYDTQYTLWNMSIARKFLKNNLGELELSVFDLLGENKSVSQSVTGNYLEETRTQVLQRYFMLTFSYNFRNFHS